MFAIIAATLFFGAFLLAAGTIAFMMTLYHDKMVAALLFQPIPQEPAVYELRVRRPRLARTARGTTTRHAVRVAAA